VYSLTEGNPFFGNAFEKQSEFRKKNHHQSSVVNTGTFLEVFGGEDLGILDSH